MKIYRRQEYLICMLCLISIMTFTSGCGRIVNHFTQPIFDDLTTSLFKQKDLVLTEQGAPAFLLLIDGLIEHSPDSKSLLVAGSSTLSAYNGAFVGKKYPERNKILAKKAKSYAIRALSLHNKEFAEVKDKAHTEFITCLPSFNKKDVPYLFNAAGCWTGWILANTDSFDAIADLPKITSLIQRVIELDETHYYGAAHTYMGSILTTFPPSLGGKPAEARKHFEKALEIGEGKFLISYVMYAKQYAKLVYDKQLFFDLLNKVLDSPTDAVPELTLMSILAKQQAQTLIDEAREDEYFD